MTDNVGKKAKHTITYICNKGFNCHFQNQKYQANCWVRALAKSALSEVRGKFNNLFNMYRISIRPTEQLKQWQNLLFPMSEVCWGTCLTSSVRNVGISRALLKRSWKRQDWNSPKSVLITLSMNLNVVWNILAT